MGQAAYLVNRDRWHFRGWRILTQYGTYPCFTEMLPDTPSYSSTSLCWLIISLNIQLTSLLGLHGLFQPIIIPLSPNRRPPCGSGSVPSDQLTHRNQEESCNMLHQLITASVYCGKGGNKRPVNESRSVFNAFCWKLNDRSCLDFEVHSHHSIDC